jgi:hypothetical protein
LIVTSTTILSWVLAAAPVPQPSTEFADELESVEVIGTSDEFQLVAYDATGDPIGNVAFWTDGSETHIASDFAVGYQETVIVDDDVRNDSTLAPGVAAERAQAMLDILAQSDPQAGKVSCALAIAGNAAACAGPQALAAVLLCMGATYHTACACAELLGTEPPEDWC